MVSLFSYDNFIFFFTVSSYCCFTRCDFITIVNKSVLYILCPHLNLITHQLLTQLLAVMAGDILLTVKIYDIISVYVPQLAEHIWLDAFLMQIHQISSTVGDVQRFILDGISVREGMMLIFTASPVCNLG